MGLANRQLCLPRMASTRFVVFTFLVMTLAAFSQGLPARASTNSLATLKGKVVYADGQPAADALVDASIAMPPNLKELYLVLGPMPPAITRSWVLAGTGRYRKSASRSVTIPIKCRESPLRGRPN